MKNTIATKIWPTVVSFLFIAISFSASYAVPQTVNYQGYLTDSEGYPLDGTVDMVFALYEVDTGGSPLWTEAQTGVPVTDGLFSVNLGSVTPIDLSCDIQYYLGITVGGDAEMMPRQPLTSVGYSFRAGKTDALENGAVTEQKIQDNTITPEKLADVCNNGEILIMTGSGWGCGSPP